MAICKNVGDSAINLSNENGSFLCRYHRSNRIRPVVGAWPRGFCPEAYHQLYPILFSLIQAPYPQLRAKPITRKCPGTQANIEFALFRKKAGLLNRCINIIKRIINVIHIIEIRNYRIFIRVKDITGRCPYPFKEQDTFEFNLDGGQGTICPAAFNNIFPAFMPKIYSLSNEKTGRLACPDHKLNILFSIDADKGEPKRQGHVPICCRPMDNIEICVDHAQGECRAKFKKGDMLQVKNILRRIGIPCSSLFHTIYPYLLSQWKGGKLGFRSGDYDSALMQCPSPEAKVHALLKRCEKGAFKVYIIRIKGKCPLGLMEGNEFAINMEELEGVCLESFVAVYPYFLATKNMDVRCPEPAANVTFSFREISPDFSGAGRGAP